MKALMITGGQVDISQLCSLYKNNQYNLIVGVDGGCQSAVKANVPLDLMYGDFDTLNKELKKDLVGSGIDSIELPAEKNVTDTHGALLELKTRGVKEVTIVGGTGSRIDHMLSSLMVSFSLLNDLTITHYDSNNRIRFYEGPVKVSDHSNVGYKYLSVIPVTECMIIKTTGLKYMVVDTVFSPFDSLGVSNEIIGKYSIDVAYGRFMLIESCD